MECNFEKFTQKLSMIFHKIWSYTLNLMETVQEIMYQDINKGKAGNYSYKTTLNLKKNIHRENGHYVNK